MFAMKCGCDCWKPRLAISTCCRAVAARIKVQKRSIWDGAQFGCKTAKTRFEDMKFSVRMHFYFHLYALFTAKTINNVVKCTFKHLHTLSCVTVRKIKFRCIPSSRILSQITLPQNWAYSRLYSGGHSSATKRDRETRFSAVAPAFHCKNRKIIGFHTPAVITELSPSIYPHCILTTCKI